MVEGLRAAPVVADFVVGPVSTEILDPKRQLVDQGGQVAVAQERCGAGH
jgi:hypothetical protein